MITDDFRSTSERLFEKYCEKNPNMKYVYKNGDSGQQYLLVVYGTNFDKQRLFYPDYIVQLQDDSIWLMKQMITNISKEVLNIQSYLQKLGK